MRAARKAFHSRLRSSNFEVTERKTRRVNAVPSRRREFKEPVIYRGAARARGLGSTGLGESWQVSAEGVQKLRMAHFSSSRRLAAEARVLLPIECLTSEFCSVRLGPVWSKRSQRKQIALDLLLLTEKFSFSLHLRHFSSFRQSAHSLVKAALS